MATNWNGKKTAINLHMNEFYIYLCILDMASAIAVAVTTAVTNSQVPEVSECVCVLVDDGRDQAHVRRFGHESFCTIDYTAYM